jgi:hypothetical protein
MMRMRGGVVKFCLGGAWRKDVSSAMVEWDGAAVAPVVVFLVIVVENG